MLSGFMATHAVDHKKKSAHVVAIDAILIVRADDTLIR